jgi:hypothetical protein
MNATVFSSIATGSGRSRGDSRRGARGPIPCGKCGGMVQTFGSGVKATVPGMGAPASSSCVAGENRRQSIGGRCFEHHVLAEVSTVLPPAALTATGPALADVEQPIPPPRSRSTSAQAGPERKPTAQREDDRDWSLEKLPPARAGRDRRRDVAAGLARSLDCSRRLQHSRSDRLVHRSEPSNAGILRAMSGRELDQCLGAGHRQPSAGCISAPLTPGRERVDRQQDNTVALGRASGAEGLVGRGYFG